MAKFRKQLRRDMKKLSKQLYSPKGLMLQQTFDITTSFYGRKKEKKPYITLTAHGDYKISVVKLIVISMCVLSSLMLFILLFRGLFERSRAKKRRRELEEDYYYEDEELPF